MEFRYLYPGDERIIELSEMPVQGGISIALNTTGFNHEDDEIVEFAVVDLEGSELFSKRVHPQNVEDWTPSEASGGLTSKDVQDEPELYQFEEEISALFEGVPFVVSLHSTFANDMMERSWITLPKYTSFDITDEFLATHDTTVQPGEPALAASLQDIASYYGMSAPEPNAPAIDQARLFAHFYRAIIEENVQQRQQKGEAYWRAYEKRKQEEAAADERTTEKQRIQQKKDTRINALLWLCAAAIFLNLAVQLGIRSEDLSIPVMIAALGVFFLYKWIRALLRLKDLSKK